MDWESGFSERELWRRCLPDWAITFFFAPFADEVGALPATLAWTARCLAISIVLVALLPERLLDAVAGGTLLGGAAVMLFAAWLSARLR